MTPWLRNPRIWLLAGLFLLPLMLTNDSLWLDEGCTAMYAIQPDFHSWCHYLRHDVGSDCQMPLTMFLAWVSGQIVGTGEWQLRVINLLWGALALGGMFRVGQRIHLPWLPLLLAIQPYFWFYQNEARPYAYQIACGTWLLAAFVEYIQRKASGESWAWLLAGSAFFLFLGTMLAPVTVAAVVVTGAVIAIHNRWKPGRKALLVLLAGIAVNVPIAVYYYTTLLRGAKGAQLWHVDFKFFGYVIYELTGMTGLGMPIEKIRVLAQAPHFVAAFSAHWLSFALPALGFALILIICLSGLRRPSKLTPGIQFGMLTILGLITITFVTGSFALHKAFWARHFAPAFPFYVTLLGMAFAGASGSRQRIVRLLPFLLAGLLLFSAFNLRFAPSWRKENYRAAAQFARQALVENKSVWWVAGFDCAVYYDLPCASPSPQPGKVFCPLGGFWQAERLPLPDVIIYSKPDVHDSTLTVQKIIAQNHYQPAAAFNSFSIWTNPAEIKQHGN